MSWNSINLMDIQSNEGLKLDTFGNRLIFKWSCPRCWEVQDTVMDPMDLLTGFEVTCANVEVCGHQNVRFTLELNMSMGSYIGRSDVPLADPLEGPQSPIGQLKDKIGGYSEGELCFIFKTFEIYQEVDFYDREKKIPMEVFKTLIFAEIQSRGISLT